MNEKNLQGKRAFVAGVGDDIGFGWHIAKALFQEGAEVLIGTWPPVLKIFTGSLESGKFNASRVCPDGSLLEFKKVYPLDASFDAISDVPPDVLENKRYRDLSRYTISEVANSVREDVGTIDFLIHSIGNAPEVTKPLLETSRKGYLAAMSASSYSFVSLLQHFGPIMNSGGAALTLSYLASSQVIPGYGGGMSSAKAALESDTRVLAFEAGLKWGVRVNAISAGPYGSRAAKAIGFIDKMVAYSRANAPLGREIRPEEVASAACFLLSPASSGVTGHILSVDAGLGTMGVAPDSKSFTTT
jgi:enoyl-[acyl-carrier protein] reductase I